MPLPPSDPSAGPPAAPRVAARDRATIDSPRAATERVIVYRQRLRERPRERGVRVFGLAGALLVHLLFLFSFVLGPAYEPPSPPASDDQVLQVRLIDLSQLPPPPVRGTPPRKVGPVHRGHARQRSRPVAQASRAAATPTGLPPVPASMAAASPLPPLAKVTVVAPAVQPPTKRPAPQSPTPPTPAPAPALAPVPLDSSAPAVTLAAPSLRPPAPPRFQPESVRQPQSEGTRPMPSPTSLALPELPAAAPSPVAAPTLTVDTRLTVSAAPVDAARVRVEAASAAPTPAPPTPIAQAVPVPTQPSPQIDMQATVNVPVEHVEPASPTLQAVPAPAETPLEAVPRPAMAAAPAAPPVAPRIKVDQARLEAVHVGAPDIHVASVDTPPVPVQAPPSSPDTTPAQPDTAEAATPDESGSASAPTAAASTSPTDSIATEQDVSSAPDATPQGSDSATPGHPEGVTNGSDTSDRQASAMTPVAGQGAGKGHAAGKSAGAGTGQPGGERAGAAEGEKQGALPDYVQLKPHGDTKVMSHRVPGVDYKPTRFDQDWTPEGESSIDTALRHAVEKTTVSHTFELPRGIRIKCVALPLLPMAVLACGNGDPPPRPVPEKVYDRMYMAPAKPLVPALSASTPPPAASGTASAPVRLDNSVQCAEARVAGGPPPPGCRDMDVPAAKTSTPAAASSSWVPASDQFH